VKRRGFALLEILCVLFMMGILLSLGSVLLLTVLRADHVGAATIDEITRRAELADQFRTDVAAAIETPAKLGEFTAGRECLILHTATGHVVYRWHDGTLERNARGGGPDVRRPISFNPENTTVEFIRGPGDRPLVTVRVVESPPRGAVKTVEISAALGGDLR
jgi:prepilin-type N-terminal cleavage/methylation domain-containing protein